MEFRTRHQLNIGTGRFPGRLIALAIALLPSAMAFAGDDLGARAGVKAKPGEIVLLRDVATRPAYRQPLSPGMALIVNPSPRQQIDNSLGLGQGELSDADVANLGATPRQGNTAIGRVLDRALGTNLGHSASGNSGMVARNGVSNVVDGSTGSIGPATRGIGEQVTSALSQLPLSTAAAGIGH
ncbi:MULTISPECIES: hypothetical protein [Rhodanobacter]|uniref:Uncharacterized protein n=1 Tax=Rhodanobacter glycinis TaxID=582702 RepID=A0A1I3YT38_9GAMM|nr:MULTISPECIES: hypothetical protein [Rhodanobacter]EIL96999.1 hypothetical protein UU5_05948 [Rhodanobacter sp. 115]SFK34401.1 hypothetical protein SAMN05192579_1028 [Rhodanobacter glycinis]